MESLIIAVAIAFNPSIKTVTPQSAIDSVVWPLDNCVSPNRRLVRLLGLQPDGMCILGYTQRIL